MLSTLLRPTSQRMPATIMAQEVMKARDGQFKRGIWNPYRTWRGATHRRTFSLCNIRTSEKQEDLDSPLSHLSNLAIKSDVCSQATPDRNLYSAAHLPNQVT